MTVMKRILHIYIPYIPLILLTGGLIIIQALLQLELPKLMAQIIDQGIVSGNLSLIYRTGATMLGLTLLVCIAAVSVSFLGARISSRSAAKLRSNLFDQVTRFGSAEIEHFGTSSLITRATNDVLQIQTTSLMLLRMGFFAPAMGIGALLMAIRTNRDLTWTIVVALAALLVLIVVSVSLSLPKFRILQKLMDRLNLIVNERLSGLLVIRAFHQETAEEQRFDKANVDLMKTNLFVSRLMSFMMPGMTLIMSYGSLLVVWAGAGLIQQDRLAIGDMMAFIQYAMHVVMSFLFLTMFFIMLPRAMVSAQRVQEVLSMEPSISEVCLENQESLPLDTPGEVVFDKVCFRYPDAEEDVLHDISFRAKPGTWTAIVGGTGSGKSTLINLLPRFYDVTQGSITVDGVDIRHLCHENLRQLIGYVPQKGILFSGSIRSNVTYANPEMDETTLTQAMKISQSYDFVEEKPEGLETSIAQGGTNVSGGQRQRLSIARAIAKNSPIYIFDDSFSALDFATEVSLRKAMLNSLGNRTVFVVAQRISTVKDAHQIIVLEEGKVAGMGTHSQLLGTCPVYRELAASQLQITSEGGDSHGRS